MAINRHFLHFSVIFGKFLSYACFRKITRGLIGDFHQNVRNWRKCRFRHFRHFWHFSQKWLFSATTTGDSKNSLGPGGCGGTPPPLLGDRPDSQPAGWLPAWLRARGTARGISSNYSFTSAREFASKFASALRAGQTSCPPSPRAR